jgi:hypothetical protein
MSNTTNKKKRPSHALYQVSDGAKPQWTKIGAAWLDKTGEGFTIKLEAFPASGHIAMRPMRGKQPNIQPE